MHPFLRDRKTLVVYLSAWCVLGFIFSLMIFLSFGESVGFSEFLLISLVVVPVVLFYGVVGLPSYYLCRLFPLHSTTTVFLLSIFVTAAAFIGFCSSAFAYIWAMWIQRIAPDFPLIFGSKAFSLINTWGGGFLTFLLMSVIHYLIIGIEYTQEAKKQALALTVVAQDAELRALRAQIDPHFLFNSLNSILSLIVSNPTEAQLMTQKLADFLRRSLKHMATELIPLHEELDLIDNYLGIEKVRFGNNLVIENHIDDSVLSFPVPSLLLQPLIENAVQHGIAQCINGGTIRISATMVKNKLSIRIENPIDPESIANEGTGTGLKNVRLRLKTIYGNEARLFTEQSQSHFTVEVILPSLETKQREHYGKTQVSNDHRG